MFDYPHLSRPPTILVLAVFTVLILPGCSEQTEDFDQPVEIGDYEEADECDPGYHLPDGESYAFRVHSMYEPEGLAEVASGYLSSIPPILLFAQGISDGYADVVDIDAGVGERTSNGYDETPNTQDDVYSMYYGSMNPDTCEYHASFDGELIAHQLEASTDRMELDLSGFSSLTEGVALIVEDVELTGEFSDDMTTMVDGTLSGRVGEEGVQELLDAVQELIPMSEEQAMEILDPDGDGVVPVELGLFGHQVVVDGFAEASDDDELQGRETVGGCCPEGLDVGDSVIPHLTWEQQGLSDDQRELFQLALPQMRNDAELAMVATAVRQEDGTVRYEVYSGGALEEGKVIFERVASEGGVAPEFEIVEQTGANPLANVDPTVLSNYEEFLATGTNPNDVSYAQRGYMVDDPRLSFISPEQMHYPYAYERIAQNFDDPRAGDLMLVPASWSTGGFGTHGNLGALQSRSPLVMAGPGLRTAAGEDEESEQVAELGNGADTLLLDDAVRHVDVAPTVAAALGVEQTTGVGPDMRIHDDLRLEWQDGRVLEEIFTDEALAQIEAGEPVADRAIIIINDGLTNIELLYQALSDDPAFDVDSYRRLFEAGLAYRHGAISNFPSNTYPGHNTVGAGSWSGHHGLVDNRFWAREQAMKATPISDLFETEFMFGSAQPNLPVETLHQAVGRTFGGIESDVVTASINDPSTRGAELASLEHREPGGFEAAEEADAVQIGDETRELPEADLEDYAGVLDNGSAAIFADLYQDHVFRGEDGLPIPRYSIVNFTSTDSAGHASGPHGDRERFEVISRVNRRMGVVLDVLEHLEIDDSTLVVLTSDHGMELQDRSRSSARTEALRSAGVEFRRTGAYVYFKQLAVEVESVEEGEEGMVFSMRAIDRATADTEEPTGVEGLEVEVVNGGLPYDGAGVTDRDGRVEMEIDLDAGADSVLFEFDNDDWNVQRRRVDL